MAVVMATVPPPPHLQDGDVPGEALQRLLQLPTPQPLLGLDAVQLLVEVHAWARGTRGGGTRSGPWGTGTATAREGWGPAAFLLWPPVFPSWPPRVVSAAPSPLHLGNGVPAQPPPPSAGLDPRGRGVWTFSSYPGGQTHGSCMPQPTWGGSERGHHPPLTPCRSAGPRAVHRVMSS